MSENGAIHLPDGNKKNQKEGKGADKRSIFVTVVHLVVAVLESAVWATAGFIWWAGLMSRIIAVEVVKSTIGRVSGYQVNSSSKMDWAADLWKTGWNDIIERYHGSSQSAEASRESWNDHFNKRSWLGLFQEVLATILVFGVPSWLVTDILNGRENSALFWFAQRSLSAIKTGVWSTASFISSFSWALVGLVVLLALISIIYVVFFGDKKEKN